MAMFCHVFVDGISLSIVKSQPPAVGVSVMERSPKRRRVWQAGEMWLLTSDPNWILDDDADTQCLVYIGPGKNDAGTPASPSEGAEGVAAVDRVDQATCPDVKALKPSPEAQ